MTTRSDLDDTPAPDEPCADCGCAFSYHEASADPDADGYELICFGSADDQPCSSNVFHDYRRDLLR